MSDERREKPDAGSAVIEFSVAGLILLVPLIYLVVTLGRLQAASYAVTSAATAASSVTARAADQGAARESRRIAPRRAAERAAALALRDHGFAGADRTVTITCTPSCTTPRGVVTARVTVNVQLPGVPAALDAALPTHIAVTARHADEVAAYGYQS